MDLVVASNLEHANALAHWLKLDAELTETLTYGSPVSGYYHKVYLARPISGVDDFHTDWVIDKLMGHVYGKIIPMSPTWKHTDADRQAA